MSSKRAKPSTSIPSVPSESKYFPIKFRTSSSAGASNSALQLSLHVKPGAKVSRVAEITETYIGLQISAPPRDGEANEEVIRYIAEIFRVKERQVSLISGHKSRDKVVLIESNENFKNIEHVQTILSQNQD